MDETDTVHHYENQVSYNLFFIDFLRIMCAKNSLNTCYLVVMELNWP